MCGAGVMANKEQLEILQQGARVWNAWRKSDDTGQIDLYDADLSGINLSRARLSRANLRKANLSEANLTRTILRWANLSEANLRKANLSGIHLHGTSLIGANLNGSTLTDACLWETQRAGWSIQGVFCEAAYWDKARQERTIYKPGEFERLFADKIKIMLHYEGGISPIEIATLPTLIQRMEAAHPGCVLRLHSVQEAPGGATVTLVVEDGGQGNPDALRILKADIETISQRVIRAQRALLEERGRRKQAEIKLQMMYDEIFPRMMRLIMEKSQGTQINVSGGMIIGNVVAGISGENAEINYTYNDLATIETLVNEMLTRQAELPLTTSEHMQFETQLNAIQEQLATQAPNYSLLREALHTMRHILEAGVAHVLVGHWPEIMHTLQSLTRV